MAEPPHLTQHTALTTTVTLHGAGSSAFCGSAGPAHVWYGFGNVAAVVTMSSCGPISTALGLTIARGPVCADAPAIACPATTSVLVQPFALSSDQFAVLFVAGRTAAGQGDVTVSMTLSPP